MYNFYKALLYKEIYNNNVKIEFPVYCHTCWT